MIVVFDASTLVSAALKADSISECALLHAVTELNRLILSQEVEDEYREVLFRPKFDRFVSVGRRQLILDIVVFAGVRVESRMSPLWCLAIFGTRAWMARELARIAGRKTSCASESARTGEWCQGRTGQEGAPTELPATAELRIAGASDRRFGGTTPDLYSYFPTVVPTSAPPNRYPRWCA